MCPHGKQFQLSMRYPYYELSLRQLIIIGVEVSDNTTGS